MSHSATILPFPVRPRPRGAEWRATECTPATAPKAACAARGGDQETTRRLIAALRATWAFSKRSCAHSTLVFLLVHGRDPLSPALDLRAARWLDGAVGIAPSAPAMAIGERAALGQSLRRRLLGLDETGRDELAHRLAEARDAGLSAALAHEQGLGEAQALGEQSARWRGFLRGEAAPAHPIFGEDIAGEMIDLMLDVVAETDARARGAA